MRQPQSQLAHAAVLELGFEARPTQPVAPDDLNAAIEAVVADAAQAQDTAAS